MSLWTIAHEQIVSKKVDKSDPVLAGGNEPLSRRRDVASLCVFYRLYNGMCSEELFGMMPTSNFLLLEELSLSNIGAME